MKKHVLFTLLCFYLLSFCPNLAFSQVIVGNGTNESQAIPIEPYYGYSYTQTVYQASDINSSGTITSIAYFYSGISNLGVSDDDIQIYMLESTRTSFATTSDWEPIAGMTLVFNGSIPAPTTPGVDEWLTITLDTPFPYTGIDNIIVAVDANEADYDSSSDDFHCTSSGTGSSIYYRNDNTNPDPASPPSGILSSYIANITFGGINPPAEPNCTAGNTPADGTIDIAVECGSNVFLTWDSPTSGITPDIYNVYFGTSPTPPSVGTTTETEYEANGLAASTTYYYQIVPEASGITALNCPIYSFSTGTNTNDAGSGGTNEVYYFANNNNSQGTPGGSFVWDDPITLNHTEITTWTVGTDDDGYATVTLPFIYKYYGVDYTDIHIGTNGYVSFGQGFTSTGSSTDLGSTSDPDGMIALAMMDLDDRNDGQIFHGPIDAFTYAITWYHYHDYQDDNEYITMQLLLQDLPGTENDVFELRYNQNESTAIPDFLIDAVIGCEDINVNATTEYAMYREDGVGGPMFCSPLVIGFAPTEGGVQLPLDLLSFEGKQKAKTNVLKWITTNEINTSHFEIQSSINGNQWKTIGEKEAAGFSSNIENYDFIDRTPTTNTYYRLKMVDFDNTYQYSDNIHIRRSNEEDGIIDVYPNPVQDELIISFETLNEATINYEVRNLNGQLVQSNFVQSNSGINTLKIQTSDLAQGVYFVQFQSNSIQEVKRFIKK